MSHKDLKRQLNQDRDQYDDAPCTLLNETTYPIDPRGYCPFCGWRVERHSEEQLKRLREREGSSND